MNPCAQIRIAGLYWILPISVLAASNMILGGHHREPTDLCRGTQGSSLAVLVGHPPEDQQRYGKPSSYSWKPLETLGNHGLSISMC